MCILGYYVYPERSNVGCFMVPSLRNKVHSICLIWPATGDALNWIVHCWLGPFRYSCRPVKNLFILVCISWIGCCRSSSFLADVPTHKPYWHHLNPVRSPFLTINEARTNETIYDRFSILHVCCLDAAPCWSHNWWCVIYCEAATGLTHPFLTPYCLQFYWHLDIVLRQDNLVLHPSWVVWNMWLVSWFVPFWNYYHWTDMTVWPALLFCRGHHSHPCFYSEPLNPCCPSYSIWQSLPIKGGNI